MATLEQLDRRMRATSGLLAIVKTMKTLSAVKIAEFERAARASNALEEIATTALQGALLGLHQETRPQAPPRPRIVVAVGSDHGLCGAFNEDLVRFLLERLRADGPAETHLIAVGERADALLTGERYASRETLDQASAATGVARLADRLFTRVDAALARTGPARVILFHNQRGPGGERRRRYARLAPLDPRYLQALAERPWPGRTPPLCETPAPALLPLLERQVIYARAHRAFAASLAAEHAARLSTMQAAQRNIEERLSDLEDAFRGMRQEQITLEIADLQAGQLGRDAEY